VTFEELLVYLCENDKDIPNPRTLLIWGKILGKGRKRLAAPIPELLPICKKGTHTGKQRYCCSECDRQFSGMQICYYLFTDKL
jgi:hypothetical protein